MRHPAENHTGRRGATVAAALAEDHGDDSLLIITDEPVEEFQYDPAVEQLPVP